MGAYRLRTTHRPRSGNARRAIPMPRGTLRCPIGYAIRVFGASFSLLFPKNTSYQHKKQ